MEVVDGCASGQPNRNTRFSHGGARTSGLTCPLPPASCQYRLLHSTVTDDASHEGQQYKEHMAAAPPLSPVIPDRTSTQAL